MTKLFPFITLSFFFKPEKPIDNTEFFEDRIYLRRYTITGKMDTAVVSSNV